MAQYRKKPVVTEAIQFTRNNWNDVLEFTNNTAHTLTIEKRIDGIATCILPTLEGAVSVTEGDWIIKGLTGALCRYKPDIFELTYEKVAE